MRNFLAVAQLDTFDAIAALHKRHPASWSALDVIGTSLLLRGRAARQPPMRFVRDA